LLREQLLVRPPSTALVFPNPKGAEWNRSRFREQVWMRLVAAAALHDRTESGRGTNLGRAGRRLR
jgi:hypothetical protein